MRRFQEMANRWARADSTDGVPGARIADDRTSVPGGSAIGALSFLRPECPAAPSGGLRRRLDALAVPGQLPGAHTVTWGPTRAAPRRLGAYEDTVSQNVTKPGVNPTVLDDHGDLSGVAVGQD